MKTRIGCYLGINESLDSEIDRPEQRRLNHVDRRANLRGRIRKIDKDLAVLNPNRNLQIQGLVDKVGIEVMAEFVGAFRDTSDAGPGTSLGVVEYALARG